MTKIKGQIYVPNKDNPLSEDDYDLILPQTTADQIEGFSGKATQEDAEAGTSDDKVMTPLRVWDAIKKYMTTFMASAVFTGIVKVIAPAIDSNDDSVPTTSWVLSIIQKIFREHVVKDYSIAQNGYIQGGDWVGGLILQWGIVYAEQGYIIVTLPLAYSSNKYVVIGQDLDYTSNDTDGYGENVGVTQVTITSIRVSITKGRYLSYCTIGF